MIRYYDEHGNRLNIRTELDDALDNLLNSYYDKLSQMTAEQRMNYFKYEQFVEPLRYTQEIDNTIYIVRTNFNENSTSTVYDTVKRITSKNE